MKKHLLNFSLLLFLPIASFSQAYTFEVIQEGYTDLVDPISLTNGLTWDDPEMAIPIGFDFQIFETTTDSLFVAGGVTELFSSPDWQANRAFITNYWLDFADRAFDLEGEEGMPGGISPVSYQLSGNTGSRIFKMEWKNAGLYDAIDVNGNTSADFANFQLWLYEGTQVIEFHYGPGSFAEIIQVYADDEEPFEIFAGIDPFYSETWSVSPEALGVAGDPANPIYGQWTQLDGLTGPVPDGTIYRFTKNTATFTSEVNKISNQIQLFPNPVVETFQIKKLITDLQIQSIQLSHLNGQVIKEWTETTAVNIKDLSAGCYLVQFITNKGTVIKKIIKI